MFYEFVFYVILAAPLLWGCQAPWASGFLFAFVLIAGTIKSIHCIVKNEPIIETGLWLKSLIVATIGWLVLNVVIDVFSSPETGHAIAISARKLPFAAAFLSSAILGQGYLSSKERTRRAFQVIAFAGLVLAVIAILQHHANIFLAGGGLIRNADRPSGPYSNPNRFAVTLVICVSCGISVIFANWRSNFGFLSKSMQFLLIVANSAMLYVIVLTQSRLTILSSVVACGTVVVFDRVVNNSYNFPETSRFSRFKPAVVPLILMLLASTVIVLAIGQHDLQGRISALGARDESFANRASVIRSAVPLLMSASVFGHGIGSFESLFTAYQPVNVQGRWVEVHSDWLQIGIEAGLICVTLLLALCILWLRECWIRANEDNGGERQYRIVPIGAFVVVVLCSVADFPLREPATALLFFFIIGGVCGKWKHAFESAPPAGNSFRRMAPLALAAFFVLSAAICGRNAFAYACSPWNHTIFPPEFKAEQTNRWRNAVAIDPGDPLLHFFLASSLLKSGRPEDVNEGLVQTHSAIELQPNNHEFYWTQAALETQKGEFGTARQTWNKAIELAPNNARLRHEAAKFEICAANLNGPDRQECITRAIQHFRVYLGAPYTFDTDIVALLQASDCTNNEIAELWPKDSDSSLLRRARFFMDCNEPHKVFGVLRELSPEKLNNKWFYAISAALELKWNDVAAATDHVKSALLLGKDGKDVEFDRWISLNFISRDPVVFEKLVRNMMPELSPFPRMLTAAIRNLVVEKQWLCANELLQKYSSRSSELSALHAELDLQMGDFQFAANHARKACDLGLNDSNWKKWYADFQMRLQAAMVSKQSSIR